MKGFTCTKILPIGGDQGSTRYHCGEPARWHCGRGEAANWYCDEHAHLGGCCLIEESASLEVPEVPEVPDA